MSKGNSSEQRKVYYLSLCGVRKDEGLGCESCVLNGFKECPEMVGSSYRSSNGQSYQLDHSIRGRERGELGFPLHVIGRP